MQIINSSLQVVYENSKNYIIFSVPNYLCSNHYRTYDSEEQITKYKMADIALVQDAKIAVIGLGYVGLPLAAKSAL